jgi:hypothetical protein
MESYMGGGKVALPYQICTAALAADILGIDFDDSVTSDGDIVAYFDIPFKCEVSYAAIVLTETLLSVTKVPCVKFTKRPVAGSDSNATAGDIATIYPTKTGAAGAFYYDKAAQASGATLYLEPGMEVVVEIDVVADTGTPGHFKPILVVERIPETMANLTNAIETA